MPTKHIELNFPGAPPQTFICEKRVKKQSPYRSLMRRDIGGTYKPNHVVDKIRALFAVSTAGSLTIF
jgi:hypothetical protein